MAIAALDLTGKIALWVAIVCGIGAAILIVWIWIDYRQHQRNLRKMREETDRKRNAESVEIPRRPISGKTTI